MQVSEKSFQVGPQENTRCTQNSLRFPDEGSAFDYKVPFVLLWFWIFFFKVRKWVLAAGTHQVKGVWPKPGPSRDTAFWKSNSADVTTGWSRQRRGGRIPHGTGTSRWRPSRVGGRPGEATTQPLASLRAARTPARAPSARRRLPVPVPARGGEAPQGRGTHRVPRG